MSVNVNNGAGLRPGRDRHRPWAAWRAAGNVNLATTDSSAVALTVGGNNGTTRPIAGTISGSGSLTKVGTGALTLTGSNTYTGGTIVEAGILVASNGTNGSATGSGSVTLSGGTLASGSRRGLDLRRGRTSAPWLRKSPPAASARSAR